MNENKNIPIEVVLSIIRDICNGLNEAHQLEPPLVHRDVKPQNILLEIGKSDDKIVAKVSDFGIAKHLDPVTRITDAAGTIVFMPPEVLSNYENTSSDVYSVGIIFYIMLTGRFPFDIPQDYKTNTKEDIEKLIIKTRMKLPEPPSNYNSEIPKEIDKIVLKALNPHDKCRYKDAGEMLEALAKYEQRTQEDDILKQLDPKLIENINKAFELGRQYATLQEAIRILETTIIMAPLEMRKELKNKYGVFLEKWERGIII